MEWLAILQWKMMVYNNLTKERPVAFSWKENTFFYLKLKLTVGIHISARQQATQQFKKIIWQIPRRIIKDTTAQILYLKKC